MYCLRRYDKNPNQSWLVAAYTEQVTSVPFELNGVVAATLFVRSPHTKDRALKIGWKDETDEYKKHLQSIDIEKKKEELVVESFSSTQKETKVKRRTRKK